MEYRALVAIVFRSLSFLDVERSRAGREVRLGDHAMHSAWSCEKAYTLRTELAAPSHMALPSDEDTVPNGG
jgi:hypothetical protein